MSLGKARSKLILNGLSSYWLIAVVDREFSLFVQVWDAKEGIRRQGLGDAYIRDNAANAPAIIGVFPCN